MDVLRLRPSAPSPLHDNNDSATRTRRVVAIKHPAYPDEYEQNLLFQLYAWDSPVGGIHAGTALMACGLVACNSWDGYLTRQRTGDRLYLRDDDILPAGEYYYHVPGPAALSTDIQQPHKYPIYPSFEHWSFPHGHIPSRWQGTFEAEYAETSTLIEASSTPSVSSVTAAVIARDKACVVSNHRDYIERAHLCPRNELEWFQKNGMRRYNSRRELSGDFITDDMANAVAMRSDIHRAFDECKFVLARKCGQWVAHFLETTYEMGRTYHNRPVEIPSGVSTEFMLARFAWAIFPLVKAFMEQGPDRAVKLREKSQDGFHEVSKILDPAGFAQMIDTSRGRSASPKKRKAYDLPPISESKRQKYTDDEISICQPHGVNLGQSTMAPSPKSIAPISVDSSPKASPSSDDSSDPPSLQSGLDPKSPNPVFFLDAQGEEEEGGDSYFSALRIYHLRKRRPRHNLGLYCCDYSAAERANALNIPGKLEFGGGHLCMECLGAEFEVEQDSG